MKNQPFHYFKRIILTTIPVLLLYLGALAVPAQVASYTTDFPNAEPLISQGGHWITAGTPGINWYDTLCGGKGDQHISSVSTTPGYAFGPTGPAHFGDSLALLTGTWNPDQTAQATVREVSPYGYPEVEIRLRTSPKDATGYEIMWSALGEVGSAYLALAKWDGPLSPPPHYTILKQLRGAEYGVATGDVVKGTIVGNTIAAYKNGKLQFQITDNTFSKGNPGFGFNEGPNGTYGITSFTASDMVSGAAVITSPLRPTGTGGTASNNLRGGGTAVLPAWASGDTTTGVITGTPTAASTGNVMIGTANGSGTGTATPPLTERFSVGLPAPWVHQEIGGVGAAESASKPSAADDGQRDTNMHTRSFFKRSGVPIALTTCGLTPTVIQFLPAPGPLMANTASLRCSMYSSGRATLPTGSHAAILYRSGSQERSW